MTRQLWLVSVVALTIATPAVSETAPTAVAYAEGAIETSLSGVPGDAAAAAQQLFAVLRELDALAVSEIWVQIPPDAPEWDGVRDRLNRAAADGSPPTRG